MLINNAGVLNYGYFHEIPSAEWLKVMQVNLLSTMHLTSLFVPDMVAQRRGHIVFLSSIAGFVPTAFETAYSLSKFGIRCFGMALAGELKNGGVDISIVYPTWSNTAMLRAPSYGSMRNAGAVPFMVVAPEKIARKALQGIKQRKLHIYPDRFAKLFWWLNKFTPLIGAQPMESASKRTEDP
jgi:uncharacterized protein